MAKKILGQPGQLVKKSNTLVRCKWGPQSVLELRIVALLASKVRPGDFENLNYEIPVAELIGKNADGRSYKEMEKAIDRLMSRVFTINIDNDWEKYSLFKRCSYCSKRGLIEIEINYFSQVHLLRLKRFFTQYSLKEFMSLPSIYSQRLYEILKSWDDQPEIRLPLSNLYEMLDVPPSLLDNYKDFRIRVLEKAEKDIHKFTSLAYKWEPIKGKDNRKVETIRFIFSETLPTADESEKSRKEIEKRAIENRNFIEHLRCFAKNGAQCVGGKNTKAVCAMCLKLRKKANSAKE